MPDILITLLDLDTIDATPHVSVGDDDTLFAPHYLFVKLQLRTNTQSRCRFAQISVLLLRNVMGQRKEMRLHCCFDRNRIRARQNRQHQAAR
jgi:hypothetical protein